MNSFFHPSAPFPPKAPVSEGVRRFRSLSRNHDVLPKKHTASFLIDPITVTSFGTINADRPPGSNNIEVAMHREE